MHVTVTLSLPAEDRLLQATRWALSGYLQAYDVPDETVDDVVLALDEACSNVVKHAFPDADAPPTYELRADLRPGEITVEVVDGGVGFDPMAWRPGGDLEVDGRGLEIMRRVMTSVEVQSGVAGTGTRLRMRKHLPMA